MSERSFEERGPDGLSTVWYENGKKKHETRYKDGQRDGLRTEWNEDGKVVKETRYQDGEEVEELLLLRIAASLPLPRPADHVGVMLRPEERILQDAHHPAVDVRCLARP